MVNVCLDDAGIRNILGHCVGNFDRFAEVASEGDFRAGERRPLGEASGSASDIKSFLSFDIFFRHKWTREMEEILLFVVVFLVDIFPLIREALRRFLLMFPKPIEIGDGIDGGLPFFSDGCRKCLVMFSEKLLMRLQEIHFELSYKKSRDAMYNRVPILPTRKNTGRDMIAGCFHRFRK